MALSRVNRATNQQWRERAEEIAEALRYLGGSAHRDRVVEFIGAMRRSSGKPVGSQLRDELTAAFDAHCDQGRRGHGNGALFTLPFGPGSLRWALADNDWMLGASAVPQAAAG